MLSVSLLGAEEGLSVGELLILFLLLLLPLTIVNEEGRGQEIVSNPCCR